MVIIANDIGIDGVVSHLKHLHDSRNILTFVQAYSLFFVFEKRKPFHSGIINEVAKTALGTYLITENIALRGAETGYSILWNGFFHVREFIEKGAGYYIVYTCVVLIFAFVTAVLIDYCRLRIGNIIIGRMTVIKAADEKLNGWIKG